MKMSDIIPFRTERSVTRRWDNIQRELHDLFENLVTDVDDFSHSFTRDRMPLLDIYEEDNKIIIKTEVPGLSEADVHLEVMKDQVIIRGEKKNELDHKSLSYHRREIGYGRFSRAVTLPFIINPENAKATFSKGILTISIEKPEDQHYRPQPILITRGE